MRLDQLKGFLLIAETASFRRAAELLNTTQPTLSARIRILEDLLGQRLFDRAAGGVRLTQAGHDFRPYAATAVEALERAQAQLSVPDGWSGTLSVGLHSYLVQSHGLMLISALRAAFPDRLIRIETGYSDEIISLVEKGMADIGVIFVPRLTSELSVDRLGEQQVCLFASHGLSSSDPDLLERYVSVHWGEDFRAHENDALPGLGVPRQSVASPELAMQLLLQEPAMAFLDDRHVATADRGNVLLKMNGVAAYRRSVYSIRLQRNSSPTGPRLEAVIRTAWNAPPSA
ncbi:MAG: LysR family transcriptional regulator [Nitratireductor sp.]|nr:LysR family transcriptional regulator [Nitratireductor sp.]